MHVVDAWKSLKKPEARGRWTVLAGIEMERDGASDREVVAIGSGVKCLSYLAAKEGGDGVVADCHAEVLCRRAFIRFLLHQMDLAFTGHLDSIFSLSKSSETSHPLILNPSVRFHLYISHSPCGDASMTSLENSQSNEERTENEAKRRKFMHSYTHAGEGCELASKINGVGKSTTDSNPSPSEVTEPKQSFESPDDPKLGIPREFILAQQKGTVLRGRNNYESLGVLRTKPGRSDSEMSLSMSCSDKICKWNVVGFSGALISLFCDSPIYINSIRVGDFFEEVGLTRALRDRVNGHVKGLPKGYIVSVPEIIHDLTPFPCSKIRLLETSKPGDPLPIPSDTCLAWSKIPSTLFPLQFLNAIGRKQGSAKRKGVWLDSSQSLVCNAKLLKAVNELIKACRKRMNLLPRSLEDLDVEKLSYSELKELSVSYREAKARLIEIEGFKGWVMKKLPK